MGDVESHIACSEHHSTPYTQVEKWQERVRAPLRRLIGYRAVACMFIARSRSGLVCLSSVRAAITASIAARVDSSDLAVVSGAARGGPAQRRRSGEQAATLIACQKRARTAGDERWLTGTHGHSTAAELHPYFTRGRSVADFQADSAGSIPVTRSTHKGLGQGMFPDPGLDLF
jgi:hypothetical protein